MWIDSYKEIIEFAIGHEIKAYQLYMDLSKMMIYKDVRRLCEDLAKEELEHKAKLEKESAKRCKLISPLNLSKYEIADKDVNIFAHRLEILIFAIKKEHAAAKLYRDLSEIVRNEDSRKTFLWLAQQELEHKRRFELEYKNFLG
ncbi:MAG: ferritin-like domain-containing protein [Planctomycetota bacterium]|jgi:rubrerythrin